MSLTEATLWHCKVCNLRVIMPKEGGTLGCKRKADGEDCAGTDDQMGVYRVEGPPEGSDALAEVVFWSNVSDITGPNDPR